MKLTEVMSVLQAELVCGDELIDREATSACGADLMSDVLAFTKERTLLLTGLSNMQVIRTAEMSDLIAIVFVRGKRPGPELVDMALLKGIPLMVTQYALYDACGRLYQEGLSGCSRPGGSS